MKNYQSKKISTAVHKESSTLSTGYPQKLWIVYKNVDKCAKNEKMKKEQIIIDFPCFFGIMISDAFIINKGGVST